jgi:hypothetical protein
MADNTNRVAGVATVTVDGEALDILGTLTVSPFTVTREGVVGLGGVKGYKETPRIPSIEVEVATTSATSLATLEGVTNATVNADLANGKKYVLTEAWLSGEPDINAAEGTTTLRFEGKNCKEA